MIKGSDIVKHISTDLKTIAEHKGAGRASFTLIFAEYSLQSSIEMAEHRHVLVEKDFTADRVHSSRG